MIGFLTFFWCHGLYANMLIICVITFSVAWFTCLHLVLECHFNLPVVDIFYNNKQTHNKISVAFYPRGRVVSDSVMYCSVCRRMSATEILVETSVARYTALTSIVVRLPAVRRLLTSAKTESALSALTSSTAVNCVMKRPAKSHLAVCIQFLHYLQPFIEPTRKCFPFSFAVI